MSRRVAHISLAVAWLLLGAALLLVSAYIDTVWAEPQVDKVEVDPVALTVSEPSSSGFFTFTLTSEPTAVVVISMTASNNECVVLSDAAILDATNWATGVAVTVSAVDDALTDGPQNCWIETRKSQSQDPRFDGLNVRDVKVTVLDDDVAGVVVSPELLTVSEPFGSENFTLTLTSQPAASVSIPLTATNSECSVSPASVDLDASTWASGVSATVTAVNDSIADGPQLCVVQTGLTASADANYLGLDPVDVTVTVLDDDVSGQVLVSPTALTISEPDGADLFKVTLSGQPTATVSIPLLSMAPDQCKISPASLELDATNWASGVGATVTAENDAIVDGSQTCLVQTGLTVSTDPRYQDLDPDDVTVTVLDDDEQGIVVNPTALTISEPDGSGRFTITLGSQPTATVTVPLVSTALDQCIVSPASVNLDATSWSSGASAVVTAVNDAIADGSRTCLVQTGLTVSSDPLYRDLDPDDVTITVLDDEEWGIAVSPTALTISEPDGTGQFTITLASQPTATVSVPLLSTALGQCTVSASSVDLNATNWASGASATVAAVDDAVGDGTRICLIQTGLTVSTDPVYADRDPDDVTVTVLDDEEWGIVVSPMALTMSEPDGTGLFTITLVSQPTAAVRVPLQSNAPTQCIVSPAFVDLDAINWASGASALVTAVDDAIADGSRTCLIQTGPAVSSDPLYAGLGAEDVTVTVLDDEQWGIAVTPQNLTVSEPNGTGLFTITLGSQPTATVTVPLESTALGQCTVSPSSVDLNATNWASGASATVTAVDDAVGDGTRICLIQTGPAETSDPIYAGLDAEDVTVTVLDDEEWGIVVSPMALTMSEPDGTGLFTITLVSQPTATVRVPLRSNAPTQCTVSPAFVDLDATNWASGASALVTAVDDAIADGSQTCLIRTRPAVSSDPVYAGLDAEDVTVTVLDDDPWGIAVTPQNLTVSEPDGTGLFTITLASQPTALVSVPLLAPSNQCEVSPASVHLDTGNWSRGVTATVAAEDDAVVDGSQICLVQTGPSASADPLYDDLDLDDVSVLVFDDDKQGMVITPADLTISEPHGTGLVTLTLTSQPLAEVSVPLTAVGDECTVSPAAVSLSVPTWASGVTATVTAVDDARPDGTRACLVQTGPSTSADPGYVGLTAGEVTVTVLDDERGMQIYMPLLMRRWPPPPSAPTLDPIENTDGDGTYAVRWSTVPGAALYILERGSESSFSAPVQVYVGSSATFMVTQQGAGRHQYRVKARNDWGDSDYSNVEAVDVRWEAEPNHDALTQANGPLVSGLTYYGTFPSGADVQDYYYFDLAVAHTIEVSLTRIAAGQNYDLILRTESLADVAYSGKLGNADEHILTGVLPAGHYYIQVYHRSPGGSSQPYHLKVVYQ